MGPDPENMLSLNWKLLNILQQSAISHAAFINALTLLAFYRFERTHKHTRVEHYVFY